jgi:hypothetical protein
MGNTSELSFDDRSDADDDEGEFMGESDPNDDVDEEDEWEKNERCRLTDFLLPPTGKRVMGRFDDSRR